VIRSVHQLMHPARKVTWTFACCSDCGLWK